MLGRRADATLVRDAPAVRRFMPFVSPRRNESLVYFEHELAVEAAFAFLERRNAARDPARPATLFHVILAALARVLEERPRLNRFTAGGRLWQRDGVWLTFSAKQRFDDDAPLLTVKRPVPPGQRFEELVGGVHDALARSRGGARGASDREMELLLRLPPPLTRLAMRLADGADALGLLPRSAIDADPMFCSAFLANLGSVGLEAGYHHLWERGTCPIFGVVGRVRPGPDGRRRVTLKWTYDERVEDGLYCARALERLKELVESPEKL